jgi:hypothetical protein
MTPTPIAPRMSTRMRSAMPRTRDCGAAGTHGSKWRRSAHQAALSWAMGRRRQARSSKATMLRHARRMQHPMISVWSRPLPRAVKPGAARPPKLGSGPDFGYSQRCH